MAGATIAIIVGCSVEAPAARVGADPISAGSEQAQMQSAQGHENNAQGDSADPAAYGGEYGIRPSYETCMRNQPDHLSTAGHRQDCADTELQFQNQRLNRVYLGTVNALEARSVQGGRKAAVLKQAQRVWLAELDAACAIEAEQAGSTMGPAAQSTCYMDRTAKRAQQLELQQAASTD